MSDHEHLPVSPSGRLPKALRTKLKHPGRSPEDGRAGRVTLTTPLRDLHALDLVVHFLKNSEGAPPRVNRSTVIRALCRHARSQLGSDGGTVATVAGKELFSAMRTLLNQIDGESFR